MDYGLVRETVEKPRKGLYNRAASFEWDAYIGGKLLDSYNFGRAYATAQAQGESHNSRSVTLGAFYF